MGANNLSKSVTYYHEILNIFFLKVLPQVLRSLVLAACILWKRYKQLRFEHKYLSMISETSSSFSYNDGGDDEEDEHCSICLFPLMDGDDVRELRECKHRFHGLCLQRWLRMYYKSSCPLCRSLVLPEEIVREYREMQIEQENSVMSGVEKELALILLRASHCGSCNGLFI